LQVKGGKGKGPGRRTRQASSCGGPACHCPFLVLYLDPQTHIEIIRKHNGLCSLREKGNPRNLTLSELYSSSYELEVSFLVCGHPSGASSSSSGAMDPSMLIGDIESNISGGRAGAVAAATAAAAATGEEFYVRLSSSNSVHERRRGTWGSLRKSSFVAICSVVAVLLGLLSLYTVLKPNGGVAVVLPKLPLLFGSTLPTFLGGSFSAGAGGRLHDKTDSEIALDPQRTSYHYQPARNWMGGKQPNDEV